MPFARFEWGQYDLEKMMTSQGVLAVAPGLFCHFIHGKGFLTR